MDGFSLSSLIVPLGITALTLLLITAASGLFRRKLGRRFMTVHKIFAWATVAVALCHGTLVMLLFS
jgi:hypothetical protein